MLLEPSRIIPEYQEAGFLDPNESCTRHKREPEWEGLSKAVYLSLSQKGHLFNPAHFHRKRTFQKRSAQHSSDSGKGRAVAP